MLDTIGQQQQQQTQQNMNLANTDFTNQKNYPKTQISFLSDILRGQQVAQNSYQATSNPAATTQQLSPLAAAAQGFLGARSLVSTPTTTTTTTAKT